jgi:hypothetical protein
MWREEWRVKRKKGNFIHKIGCGNVNKIPVNV